MSVINSYESHPYYFILSSYLRVPVSDLMYGVTIKIKPVAKALEYSPAVFSKATVKACDNCQAMMKHAKIVYQDWHNLSASPVNLRRRDSVIIPR